MQNKKIKEKRGLMILLLIIAGYILLVGSIALYVRLQKQGYFTSNISNDSEIIAFESPSTEGVEEDLAEIEQEAITTISDKEPATVEAAFSEPEPTNIKEKSSIASSEDDDFEREYAQYMGSTIADVPAKPRPSKQTTASKPVETVMKNSSSTSDGVLSASDLTHSVEKPKGFWDTMIDKIASFFGSDAAPMDDKKVITPQMKEMLTEIEGEIGEMQSKFTSYTEENGITYIDHVNRPQPHGELGFYIYIGVAPNNYTFHRTIIRYSGADKIALQSILLQTDSSDRALVIDAKEFVLANASDEWVDLPPTQDNNELVNAVVSSDHVKVTFMGQDNNVEWVLTSHELNTLRESLYFYNLLKEREELMH